ncbi:MAG: FG-GAP-like repeat-containing protein [Phycisphaerales bacterium]
MAGRHAAWLVAGALAGALAVCSSSRADDALLAQGCAAMGQFEFEKAAALFQQAVAADPTAWEPRFDLAVALLNQSRPGAQEEAIEHLQKLAAERPDDLAVPYCHGLAALYLGNAGEAAPLFARVAAARPKDAYAQFYAAQCAELGGDLKAARSMYEQAAAIDPLLRSAWLGVQRTAGRLGDAQAADAALAQFKALADNPRSPLAEFKYTRMGTLAMPALRAGRDPAVLPPDSAPVQLGAVAPLRLAGAPAPVPLHDAGAPTTVDLNGDGLSDLVFAGSAAHPLCTVLVQQADGAWAVQPGHPLAAVPAVGLLWGDLNNDGRVDVVVNPPAPQPAYALLQQADGAWTRAALAAGDAALGRAWALADLDADGDLDLVVDWGGSPGLLLSRADGTYEPRSLGQGVPAGRLQQAVVADLTSDGLPDLLLVQAGEPAPVCTVWRAGVLWQWERVPGLGGSGVLAAVPLIDQRDGTVLVAMLRQPAGAAAGAVRLELAAVPRGAGGSSSLQQVLPMPGAEGLAALGVDSAGRSVLLVQGHQPQGGQPWMRVVQQRASNPVAAAWAVVNEAPLPCSGAQPLVLSPTGMQVVLPAEGAGAPPRALQVGDARASLAALWLKGRVDPSQQMRSNASGIGTRWTAWCTDRWVSGQAFAAGSQAGPQQSLSPSLVPPAAFITLDWPDGVLQTELAVTPGVRTLAETQRQISSCPVIFAWNGREHAFVTDCLGVGGLGYLVGAEREANGALKPVYAPPRPWERVVLGGAQALQPAHGTYDIRLTEPMEEACYLDAASMRAYDVPAGWQIALDERMGLNGPEPTGAVHAYRVAVRPARATATVGQSAPVDVTAALAGCDGVAAPLGAPDSRFIGRLAQPATLTLDFGTPITPQAGALLVGALPAPPAGTPVLLLDGWVEYPYCQTNFAMWQAGVSAEAPSLDALDPATGAWVELVAQYGYPAGMQRQCMFMLPGDRLPAGCTTLRVRTSMDLSVDRAQVAWIEPCAELVVQQAPLAEAACRFAGYPQRVPQPQRRPDYRYHTRAPLWDCRAQLGLYTQYGRCTPLLNETDDACAVFGPGEEVELRFGALPPPADGMHRTWVLDVHGWCKDMDRYTGQGAELSPMPTRHGSISSQAQELQQQFNTRFAGGRP